MIDLSKLKTAEQKAAEAAQAAKQERIAELKQLLRDTDYVALSDYDKGKPDVLLQRQAWRAEIRELEA
jgi:bifunctional ADP-heptose synthase (sugar kinase/adenylyltransferase)